MQESMEVIVPQQRGPINPIKQALLVFTSGVCLYYLITILLYAYSSPHWVWALYISPIFLFELSILTVAFIYIIENHESKEVDKEENKETRFFIVSMILPLLLILWPTFSITYFGIYHNTFSMTLKPADNAQIVSKHSIEFHHENYTMLLINYTQEEENYTGYGCISNINQNSIFTFSPTPYGIYELEQSQLPVEVQSALKLPSWVCASNLSMVGDKIINPMYTSPHNEFISLGNVSNATTIVTFRNPVYTHLLTFGLFILLIYTQLWIFTWVLIYVAMVIYDINFIEQQNHKNDKSYVIENECLSPLYQQIIHPSDVKRGIQILLAFLQMLSLLTIAMKMGLSEQYYQFNIFGILILPAIVLIIFQSCTQIHSDFNDSMKTFIAWLHVYIKKGLLSSNLPEKIGHVIFAFLSPLIVLSIFMVYISLFMYWSLYIMNMKLYYSRHFVAYCMGVEENLLKQVEYDGFVNYVHIFDWIWRGPMTWIVLVFWGNTGELGFWIAIALTTIQIVMVFYAIYHTNNIWTFLDQPSILIYQNDKQRFKVQVQFKSEESKNINDEESKIQEEEDVKVRQIEDKEQSSNEIQITL